MAEKNCLFCKIANGQDEKTTLVYQDEKVVVFRDIHPAAEHHYLVCPREHVPNAKSLTSLHIPFVENLVDIGRQVLREQNADLNKARFGFHWPPFCTIDHLHLHVISPEDRIKTFYWLTGVYAPGMPWFKSADWVIQRLRATGGTAEINVGEEVITSHEGSNLANPPEEQKYTEAEATSGAAST